MRLVVPLTVRWADLDAYGPVNNAAMLYLPAEARGAALWHRRHLPADDPGGRTSRADTATFVAHQEIEYLAPLGYPAEPIPVSLWISKLGGASAEVCYEVPTLDGGLAARARTTIVMMDVASGRPRRITEAERALWSRFIDEPVVFRRG